MPDFPAFSGFSAKCLAIVLRTRLRSCSLRARHLPELCPISTERPDAGSREPGVKIAPEINLFWHAFVYVQGYWRLSFGAVLNRSESP